MRSKRLRDAGLPLALYRYLQNHLQFLPRYQLLDGQYESLEIRVTVPNKTGPTLRSLGTAYNGQQQNIFRNIFKIEILLV